MHYVEQAVHHGLLMSRTWAATPRAPAACICLLFIPCEVMWLELQRSVLKPREEDALLGRSLNILIASGWQLFPTMASSVGKAVDDFMLMLRGRHLEYCHLRQLEALRIISQRINDKHWCDHCHHRYLSEWLSAASREATHGIEHHAQCERGPQVQMRSSDFTVVREQIDKGFKGSYDCKSFCISFNHNIDNAKGMK